MKLAFAAAASSPHTIKWVNAMAGAGHEITLFSMPDHKDEFSEIDEKAKIVYLDVPESQGGTKSNVKQFKALLADTGYEALCAFDMTTYGFMAAKAKAAHVLLVSTGLDVYTCADTGKKSLVKKSVKHADAVCATAPNIITKIKDYYKNEKKYFVTPFGVDMDKFTKRSVPHDKPCFGSIKFLEPGNGVDAVIEAFAKFLGKYSADATLKVVGSGSYENGLKQKADQLGVADKVEFVGYVKNSDMPGVINTMDAVVQMTKEECFGVSAMEAMACEVPLVASDTYGASEFILNGVTGYLVKPDNLDACADRMMDIIKNNESRERMGHLCREDTLPLYNLPLCVQKFEEAIKSASNGAVL